MATDKINAAEAVRTAIKQMLSQKVAQRMQRDQQGQTIFAQNLTPEDVGMMKRGGKKGRPNRRLSKLVGQSKKFTNDIFGGGVEEEIIGRPSYTSGGGPKVNNFMDEFSSSDYEYVSDEEIRYMKTQRQQTLNRAITKQKTESKSGTDKSSIESSVMSSQAALPRESVTLQF